MASPAFHRVARRSTEQTALINKRIGAFNAVSHAYLEGVSKEKMNDNNGSPTAINRNDV